ncbi:MAG: hypothetical protein ACR2H6_06845, partial [Pyrinomonadaceae bacterium]
RATGALLTIIAISGAVISVRGGYLSAGGAAVLVAPMIIAGLINLLLSGKRMLAALSVVCAALLFPILVLNSGMVRLTTSESVRDLVAAANERGYGAAPVYGLGEIDRTAEFYASGRLAYGADGEPVVFENARQVYLEAYKRGPILILVPQEYDQLLMLKTLGAEPIGDNGRFVLIAVQKPMPQHY